jgi:hypothetical protein
MIEEEEKDPLAEALDVFPLETTIEEPTNYSVVVKENETDADIQHVRSNLYDLIDKGTQAVNNALKVANEMQHPRAYEVAGNLIKNIGDLTDKLVNLQKAKQELNTTKEETNVNIDKAVIFNGSTAELLKMIKNGDS